MNGRVITLDSDEHHAVQALLPWFANGTLASDEARRLEAHVQGCARCEADLARQRSWRASLAEADAAVDPDRIDRADRVEHDWDRLRSRLATVHASAPDVPMDAGTRRRLPRWVPFALAGQTALIGALLVAGLLLVPMRGEAPYRALGAAPSDAAHALVVFRPDASEAQIRQALRMAEARLVGGPTVTDAYLLRLKDVGPAALARLREQPGVERVESLDAGGQR